MLGSAVLILALAASVPASVQAAVIEYLNALRALDESRLKSISTVSSYPYLLKYELIAVRETGRESLPGYLIGLNKEVVEATEEMAELKIKVDQLRQEVRVALRKYEQLSNPNYSTEESAAAESEYRHKRSQFRKVEKEYGGQALLIVLSSTYLAELLLAINLSVDGSVPATELEGDLVFYEAVLDLTIQSRAGIALIKKHRMKLVASSPSGRVIVVALDAM